MPGATPVSLDNYRFSRQQELFLQQLADDLQAKGYIRDAQSPWNTPINLVPKGDSYRLTLNYRPTVNRWTYNDDFPLPLIRPLLQRMTKYRWFAEIDLVNGYWNLPTSDRATQDLLAFTVPGRGQKTWNVLPQGLKQAPSIFQRFMTAICEPYTEWAVPYLDNIIIGASSLEELTPRFETISKLLSSHQLPINKDKTTEAAQILHSLGFVISHNSVVPDNGYLRAIAQTPVPATKTDLRRFLGKVSHVVQHFPHLLDPRAKLFRALNAQKGNPKVTLVGESLKAFHIVRQEILGPRTLNSIDPTSKEPIKIVGDAGGEGYASMAFQGDNLVGTLSRKYPRESLAYAASLTREAWCLKESLLSFSDLIAFIPFSYVTDNLPLFLLCRNPLPTSTNHAVLRSLEEVQHLLARGNVTWVPRTDPLIRTVDEFGRLGKAHDHPG